jgi:hypothetical protein
MKRPTIRARVEPGPARRQAQSLGFFVGICIAVLLALGWGGKAMRDRAPGDALCPPEKINPNDAPLTSLMRLPGVGLTRARAIVDYRNKPAALATSRPAFTSGQDMQRIKGFGPATVKDILPWLQFPPLPAECNGPSGTD